MQAKRAGKDSNNSTNSAPSGISKDLKIAMCVMLDPEDWEALSEQFGVYLNK